jgi:hypothetical protein
MSTGTPCKSLCQVIISTECGSYKRHYAIVHYDSVHFEWSTLAKAMRVLSSHGLRVFPSSLAVRARNAAGVNADDWVTKIIPYTSVRGIDNALVMENIRDLSRGHRLSQRGDAPSPLLPLEDLLQLCFRFDSGLVCRPHFRIDGSGQ